MRTTVRALVVLGAATAAAFGMTEVMSVDPVKASWAGYSDSVSQVITLNVDTLKRVDVFLGFSEGSENYDVNVFSYPDGTEPLAQGSEPPGDDHVWLPFNLTVLHPDSFVKGRRFRVEVSRGGTQDSIHFYWAEDLNSPYVDGPYKYGEMVVGDSVQQDRDLCARVNGVMDTIEKSFFGVNEPNFIPSVGANRGHNTNFYASNASSAVKCNTREVGRAMLAGAWQRAYTSARCGPRNTRSRRRS